MLINVHCHHFNKQKRLKYYSVKRCVCVRARARVLFDFFYCLFFLSQEEQEEKYFFVLVDAHLHAATPPSGGTLKHRMYFFKIKVHFRFPNLTFMLSCHNNAESKSEGGGGQTWKKRWRKRS